MYYKLLDRDLVYTQSLAKWKREAEAWYGRDSAMLEGLLHAVEENVVRKHLIISSGVSITIYST